MSTLMIVVFGVIILLGVVYFFVKNIGSYKE